MPDLDPEAVKLLWPVLQLVGLFVTVLAAVLGAAWAGFRWLRNQIKATATEMLAPVNERIALVERDVKAAHDRMDRAWGPRPP